jgi:hypothetical protein
MVTRRDEVEATEEVAKLQEVDASHEIVEAVTFVDDGPDAFE